MNEIVIFIAQREKINSTLFFSKKAQKDFLRLALSSGLQEASMENISLEKRSYNQ